MPAFEVQLRCFAVDLPAYELETTVEAKDIDAAMEAVDPLLDEPWPDVAEPEISALFVSIVRRP